MYGKRATPYEVLSAFSERLAGAYGDEDLLPRMARILGEGTGAERADVWLKEGDRFRPVAGWPSDAPALPPAPVDAAPGLVPVRHQGELLGALSIDEAPRRTDLPDRGAADRRPRVAGRPRAAERRVDRRPAQLASAARRGAGRGAPQDRAEPARRRAAAAGRARGPAQAGPDPRRPRPGTSRTDARAACRAPRRARSRTSATSHAGSIRRCSPTRGSPRRSMPRRARPRVPVTVESDGFGRYPREVESTLYFCALEALNNVAKYAEASRGPGAPRADGRACLVRGDG